MYSNKFSVICIFTFIVKHKTENQAKIYLSYWLTDENEYIHDSFVVVSKLKNIKKSVKTFYRYNLLKLIKLLQKRPKS